MPTTTLRRAAELTARARVTDGAHIAFEVGRSTLSVDGITRDVSLAVDTRTGAPLVRLHAPDDGAPTITYVLDVDHLLLAVLAHHVADRSA